MPFLFQYFIHEKNEIALFVICTWKENIFTRLNDNVRRNWIDYLQMTGQTIQQDNITDCLVITDI